MAWLTWLADVLRAAGLPVREIDGWRTRGHGAMAAPLGVVLHHTAGPAAGNYPSERVVVAGRPGLAGPLCNVGLARDGTWIVVAAGSAWHAGTGSISWCPRDQGNTHLIGVEAESTGRGDWTPAQLASYPRGVAALLAHLGLGSYRAIGHKEWAPGRKIDPAGWPGDMPGFRAEVTRWLTTAPTAEEEPLMALSDAEQRELLDRTRDLTRWLGPTSFVPPGGDPAKPWSVTTGQAAANVYVATFYGGSSTGGRSLFQAIAQHGAGQLDTGALAAAVVDVITRQGGLAPATAGTTTTALPAGAGAGPAQLTDSELARVAKACADEQDRRARSRLA